MIPSGFLVLLQRQLKEKYGPGNLNINVLLVIVGPKIIVHGPNRTALGDTDILAEITSVGKMEVTIKPLGGTTYDHALLKKTIEEIVQPETKVVIKK